ncbi:hypothetical protein evm_012904 [Chilo suppressalis]|nr:hypothetical protein evm_012904 [Chilo suppressalis]
MSQKQSKKRGANYTQEEKSLLLDLIMQYKDIVESKRTGGIFTQKKRDAWSTITAKYNSNGSGPRDVGQLKALYDNMKQKSRKEIGEKNDLTQALLNVKEDKMEMKKTGGGFWKPRTTEADAKVLSIIQEQTEPLCNPYDSAAGFFNDIVDITCMDQNNIIENNNIIQASTSTLNAPCLPVQDILGEKTTSTCPGQIITTPKKAATECPKNDVKRNELPIGSGSMKKPSHYKIIHHKNVTKRKLIKASSSDQLKKLYFKKKFQNAESMTKNLMLDILHKKKEHELRMQISRRNLVQTITKEYVIHFFVSIIKI